MRTSDAERQRLAGLVPSVVGLTSDDVRVDLRIALRAALTALPVVAEERQRTMALTVLVVNRLLAVLDGRPAGDLEETVNIAILDGDRAVNVSQVRGPAALSTHNWVGQGTPLHATSSGKVLLAHASDAVRIRMQQVDPRLRHRSADVERFAHVVAVVVRNTAGLTAAVERVHLPAE